MSFCIEIVGFAEELFIIGSLASIDVVSVIPVPKFSLEIISSSFAVIDGKGYRGGMRGFVRSCSVTLGGTGRERSKLIVNTAAASAANACHPSCFSSSP